MLSVTFIASGYKMCLWAFNFLSTFNTRALGEKQRTLATLDMSMHEIEAVDKHVDNLDLCMHEVQDSK